MTSFVLLGHLLLAAGPGWVVDHPRPGVTVLRDETGAFGGFSMGVSHINTASYQARKTFDLTALPAGAVAGAKAARLRLYLAIQDYSWNIGDKQANGLNEAFEIVLNDRPTRYETADPRFPSKAEKTAPLKAGWVDLELPLADLQGDTLEVILRKTPDGKGDDYVYPGIDNSVEHGHSAVTFDGAQTWHTDTLNTIKARGEYMMRLVLSNADLAATARWTAPDSVDDPAGLLAYHGHEGTTYRFEPNADAFDLSRPLTAVVHHQGTLKAAWLGLDGKPLPAEPQAVGNDLTLTLPPGQWEIDALSLTPAAGAKLDSVEFSFEKPTTPARPTVDLRPEISPAKGRRSNLKPSAKLTADTATLTNQALRAVFTLRPKLGLQSLYAAEVDRNILVRPEQTKLFAVKVGETVYGSRDGTVVDVKPVDRGFVATVALGDTGLQGKLTAVAESDELRLGFELVNTGKDSARFYVSFPQLSGLELSEDVADDAYLFPWGGGVIASVPAYLRTSYGEETAWWQMIDLFSPTRGGGVYLRADDPTALYKNPVLRKGAAVHADYTLDETGRGFIEPDMFWRGALEPDAGCGVTFEYLRRDREPGQSFKAPDACLGTHAGDWREGLQRYVDWSHQTWPPRPYPSKLTDRWNILATGWGQGPLFKDGAYRTDYFQPKYDVAELMSWWSWSDKGPWEVPMDRLQEELGQALYDRYKSYWVVEPVSGKLMYPLNRGDYDGYMPQWGGLPALRNYIKQIREAGLLPTFYTDPILGDANTKLARQYGREYGIMNPLWKDSYNTGKTPEGFVGSYGGYCMCVDTEWYSQFVADTMARVCRETGVDGIRLDEYGHRGYVCTSPHHQHLFAEPGHNAWLQAITRNCRQVHDAMDQVRPDLVLTAEFPGHDAMAASLDGAICYDIRRLSGVRPTPLNLFRFFFPECKMWEIDRPHRRDARNWMLWNTVAAFSAFYPDNQHVLLQENTAAIENHDAEPLVPTLVPRVYANRYVKGDKTIWMLNNATGHTVDAALLEVEPGADHHFVNLETGTELSPGKLQDGRLALSALLRRDETLVVARLPKLVGIADGKVTAPVGLTLHAVAADGSTVATLQPGDPWPTGDEQPAVALHALRAGQLVDLATAPK